MAAIDHSAYAPSSLSGLGVAIRRVVDGTLLRVRTHLAYRRTLQSLSTLSDRELMDIGLDGADLDAVARNTSARSIY